MSLQRVPCGRLQNILLCTAVFRRVFDIFGEES